MRKRTRGAFGAWIALLAIMWMPSACLRLPGERLFPDGRIVSGLEADYISLLSGFPKDEPGLGKDQFFPGDDRQPMAHGLVVSAEAARFGRTRTEESRAYVRTGVRRLLDSRDLDGDHFPGWGLPAAWDAFGDGSVNPPNTPYTITTAICLLGLLDALRQPLWSNPERGEIAAAVRDVELAWCRAAWTDIRGGGFFWYSVRPADAVFLPNVGAMLLGAMARSLEELRGAFSDRDARLIRDRIDRAAASIASRAVMRAEAPFWNYVVKLDVPDWEDPNDLVHHAYILWGLELYRSFRGTFRLPWSRTQARRSLDRFWKDGRLFDAPQDLVYEGKRAYFNRTPAVLWGMGIAIALYAVSGDRAKALDIAGLIDRDYGPFPRLRRLPEMVSKDENFYVREAAHVLWGWSLLLREVW